MHIVDSQVHIWGADTPDRPWPPGQAHQAQKPHPHIRTLVDAFGPRRVFWGTDLTRMPRTYRECVTLFTEELPWLKGADLEGVMGRGVCEWLGWSLP
jgi:predicted TIM-barrel fold metal-dependent hydrolase